MGCRYAELATMIFMTPGSKGFVPSVDLDCDMYLGLTDRQPLAHSMGPGRRIVAASSSAQPGLPHRVRICADWSVPAALPLRLCNPWHASFKRRHDGSWMGSDGGLGGGHCTSIGYRSTILADACCCIICCDTRPLLLLCGVPSQDTVSRISAIG